MKRKTKLADVGAPRPRAVAEPTDDDEGQAAPRERPADDLRHELQTHKIELELQNEELRRLQVSLEESRDRFVDLFDFAPVAYVTITGNGTIHEANLAAATLLGVERARLSGRRFAQFVAPVDRDRWHRVSLQGRLFDEPRNAVIVLLRSDGSMRDVRADYLRVSVDGDPAAMRIALTDITELRAAEREMRIAATMFESREGMFVTDADGVIQRVNRAFTKITGYGASEAIGRKPSLLKSGRHDADFYAGLWTRIISDGSWEGEIWNRSKDGTIHPQWLNLTAVPGESGGVSYYVGTLTDITERKAVEDQVRQMAFFDPLTHLPNRRLLLDRLSHALVTITRSGEHGAILFLDLDDFKTLNDSRGHNVGDLLLQAVAQRLSLCVREGDTVARLGGDEYVVMLEHLSDDAETAATVAARLGAKINEELAKPYLVADGEVFSTASIGIALFGQPGEFANDVLKRADLAMYESKTAGGNTVHFFDQKMEAAVTARVALDADLRRALRADEFVLHYQPQVDGGGRIVGAEALSRWNHPQRGLIDPEDFITAMEKSELIVQLGQGVLQVACRQLATWAGTPATTDLRLSVNVSPREFRSPDFAWRVLEILESTGANPKRLTLEITESELLVDHHGTIAKMETLKAHGVRFAVDDFGTGYSSLAHLKHLPLDELKIDRSFVHDLLTDTNDAAIARAIIALGGSLGITVVAEGVETPAQRDFLASHGCQYFQGRMFGMPVTGEEFSAQVAGHSKRSAAPGKRRGSA